MRAIEADVAIVGGGPAGCAAALTLRRYTRRRVVLVERFDRERPRIGETVSAALGPLLANLGVDGSPNAADHSTSYGTRAAWGQDRITSRDFLFTGRGLGWHLDRSAFDRRLLDAAEAAGARVLRGASARGAARGDGLWRLEAGALGVAANQVIDATGRGGAFARWTGARRHRLDRLVGVAAKFALPPETVTEQNVLIEAVAEGWWYSAPVPGRRLVVVFMTDADLLPLSGMRFGAWEAELAETRHTRERCRDAQIVEPPRAWPAGSSLLFPPLGEGWVAAGDAAISFDPLSSLGIGHAIASGIQAARIVDERLGGGETLSGAYPGDILKHRDAYLSQRAQFYAAERRFPDAPFWRRRHREGIAGPALEAVPALE